MFVVIVSVHITAERPGVVLLPLYFRPTQFMTKMDENEVVKEGMNSWK